MSTLSELFASRGVELQDWLGASRPRAFTDVESEWRHVDATAGLIDRSYRACLEARGDGVCEFLNGIISAKVDELEIDQGCEASFLTAKGRLLGHFRIFRVARDACRLIFAEPHRDEFEKALNKYAFLNDIELENRSADCAFLSVEGPLAGEAVEACARLTGPLPADERVRCAGEIAGCDVQVYRGGESRAGGYDIEVAAEAAARVWEALEAAVGERGGGAVGLEAAEIARVEAGRGVFGIDFDSDNFPNDARLESSLDYTKCYVGQEVVARMRTYGQANRRLMGLQIAADESLEGGVAIRDDRGDVGRLGSLVRSPRHGAIGLSVLARRAWNPGTKLGLEGHEGAPATVVDLPFEVAGETAR